MDKRLQGMGLAGRAMRALAGLVLALAAPFAAAAPAPGTAISNQATATATGVGPASSNIVTAIVGAPLVGTPFAALLSPNNSITVRPGDTVTLPHSLRNTGTSGDTYTLTATDLNTGYAFASVALYADANGDGVADSAVPIAAPVAVAAGATFRFVMTAVVPAGASGAVPGRVRVAAASAGGAVVTPVQDQVYLQRVLGPADCAVVGKFLSAERGPSPAGPVTVTLTYDTCGTARSKLVIHDPMPAGMRYVAGSARFNGIALTDAVVGNDRQGTGAQVAWDFGVTQANTATATLFDLPADTRGSVSFQVSIDAGLAVGSVVENVADYAFSDANGVRGYTGFASNRYQVTGRGDFELTGERVPTADPGTTVAFANVLRNKGDLADTFDVTFEASTFPAGTVIALFQADGVTPLADTDGNGTPDTGVVPAGGSATVILKVRLPENAPAGAYKVTKTARSARSPAQSSSAEDVIEAVARKCRVVLDPDNQAQVGRGQHVTYTHYLTNRGNCEESVQARVDYIANSQPGWTAAAYVDNMAAGTGSLPGAVDPTDAPIQPGWTATIRPGESMRVLVDVRAPTAQEAAAAQGLKKAMVDSNVTTLSISSNASGSLVVKDTTIVDDKDAGVSPDNAIRNFTDSSYAVATVQAAVGGRLWLRADASACNADPAAIETRSVVLTGPGGEREAFTARETGANTGIFVVDGVPVRAPPVVAGDGIVEGRANDTFDIEIAGCGRRIATVVSLVEPVGVVFDSATNEPVAGAVVNLVAAPGGRCGAPSGNGATTGTDGRFGFASPGAGSYCLLVTPPNGYTFASKVPYTQLPGSRNLRVTGPTTGGSYGTPFDLAAGEPVVVDIPVDAAARDGLFLQKVASRLVVEVGEFVDYAVRVRNNTGAALDRADVVVEDELPAGFAFMPGSARRDGQAIADPSGSRTRLAFSLGRLAKGAQALLTYRLRVGPGALQGDGVNRAIATYTAQGVTTRSNVGSARVQVTGGVFGEKGFVLGKAFMDCNGDGVQNPGEPGVPGLRLVMEDGTLVLTDGEGKYSFYGLAARTHVLKIDRTSMPPGTRAVATSARQLGDGGSRIVDLKWAEMQRADFALAGCSPGTMADIAARAEALRQDELGLATTRLDTEARSLGDTRALPASGMVAAPQSVPMPGATGGPVDTLVATGPAKRPSPAPRLEPQAAVDPQVPLEELVPSMDKALGFVGLADGQVMPGTQATVRVKGTQGAAFTLTVNGEPVPESAIGKRASLAETQVEAWEFIGIELKPGENVLVVSQKDAFGNARGSATVRLVAPGAFARLVLEGAPEAMADGKTPMKLTLRVLDARGTPVASRTPVSLEASTGRWQTPDLDPNEPGLQVMVEGGRAELALLPPTEPGPARIVAASGNVRGEVRVDFLPELRSLVAAGVLEGIVNFRNAGSKAVVPTREADGFEHEIRSLSREWNDGRESAAARAAFYLKGKVRGDYLLTAAYDSDKDTRERLFRDIQPDEFYPVYGDSAVRGFDAQSTSHLYVRVDKNKSYLLWGDFTTQSVGDARKLTNYSRSLTGAKVHVEEGPYAVTAFASRDSSRQVIDEVRANGTSGPYTLSTAAALANSEKVEIVTRDRNQPSIIVAILPQSRFADYEVESLTGRILFRAPVASVDSNLNPVFVRITYEVDQGGALFWVSGVEGTVRLGERAQVGGIYVRDQNPLQPFTLAGAHAAVRIGEYTYLLGEVAQSKKGADDLKGQGGRLEIKHDGQDFKAQAFIARTDRDFDNPGAYLTQGRSESGAKVDYKVREGTTVRAEALRTEDVANNNSRDGVAVSVRQEFGKQVMVEVGVRHAREKGTGSAYPAVVQPDGKPLDPAKIPDEVTTVRARVTAAVPGVTGASVYGEAEVDVQDADRKVIAAGGEYQLKDKGRIYARHEFISSITGPYGLNPQERQNTTAVGVDTEYMKDGRLFSEYRIRDAMSGGDVEAALGLKNLWSIAPGLRLGTVFERVQAVAGSGQNENTAVALALEYTGSDRWKASTRLEVRDGHAQDSLLFTVGLAARLDRQWTLLARNAYTLTRNADGTEHGIERLQAGVALRDADENRWNGLARVEHRTESDDTQQGIELKRTTELLSIHGDWQLTRPFLVGARYAAKWTGEKTNGLTSRYRAQAAGVRGTWEFAPKWDLSLAMSILAGSSPASRQYNIGVELGYLIATNLWVSAGYNFAGYREDDLAQGDYTAKGAFVRMRYKFDETLLEGGK